MQHNTIPLPTLTDYKKEARTLQKSEGISYTKALNLLAKKNTTIKITEPYFPPYKK